MNQHTDEVREERRHTKPEFNGCTRYKRNEYCQPCVAMASNYTYTGESDRRAMFYQYANEVSEITRYQDALREAREALESCKEDYNEYLDFKGATGMEQIYDEDKVKQALATINKLLGEKP